MFPTKILLATDGSEGAAHAARAAVGLSERFGSPLHVVYVEPLAGYYPVAAPTLYYPGHMLPEAREEAVAEAEKRLDEEAMKVGGLGEVSGAYARVGVPHAEIVRAAEEIGAGLVVVGSRGLGGVRRALIGSVSDAVVRHAHCPVLVIRKGSTDDAGARARTAVGWARA